MLWKVSELWYHRNICECRSHVMSSQSVRDLKRSSSTVEEEYQGRLRQANHSVAFAFGAASPPRGHTCMPPASASKHAQNIMKEEMLITVFLMHVAQMHYYFIKRLPRMSQLHKVIKSRSAHTLTQEWCLRIKYIDEGRSKL